MRTNTAENAFAADVGNEVSENQPPADSVEASELDIAHYLVDNPGFFTRHADVLAHVRLTDPHQGRAISLQSRQLDVLRDKTEQANAQMNQLVLAAKENEAIADRLAQWTRQLLLVRDAKDMPASVVDGLQRIFSIPCVGLRVWDVPQSAIDANEQSIYFEAVDASTRRMTDDLKTPYCGLRGDIAQARWLDDGGVNIRSVALLALRSGISPNAFGLLVFGSPDADRFQTGMGTEFLERIAQTASAAMARLTNDAGTSAESPAN